MKNEIIQLRNLNESLITRHFTFLNSHLMMVSFKPKSYIFH